MPNRERLPALGTMALVVLMANLAPGRAAETPTVTVRVRDEAQLPDRTVQEALMIAGGVYHRAGIGIDWRREPADPGAATALMIVIVAAASNAPLAIGHESMGVARTEAGVRANVAYVVYDRVRDFSDRGHVDAWIVLGCAIAHELGHLLLPVNAHTSDGIMRANWDPKVIGRAGGFLSFASDQARLLRLRIRSREQ